MNRKLCVWDLSAGTCIEELHCPVDIRSAVILSSFEDPKAAILQSYCDGTYVWYLDSSKVDKDHTLRWTAELPFIGRNVSPDGRLLAGFSSDGPSFVIWDISRRKFLWKLPMVVKQYHYHCIAFSSDSNFLATSSDDGPIQLWDMRDGKCFKILTLADNNRLESMTFHPDIRYLISTHTVDYRTKTWLWEINTDGKTMASRNSNNTIQLWDLQRLLEVPPKADLEMGSLSFSPDLSMIASLFRDGKIVIWDTATGATLHSFSCPTACLVGFSPDSSLIATTMSQKTAKIWNLHEPDFEWQLNQKGECIPLEFSPDSQVIATLGAETKIWVRESGQLVQSLPLEDDCQVLSIDARPGTVSSYSVVAVTDDNVEVWDLETCSCIFKSGLTPNYFYEIASSRESLIVCTTRGHWVLSSEPGHSRQLTQIFGVEPKCEWVQWKGHNLFKFPPDLHREDEEHKNRSKSIWFADHCSGVPSSAAVVRHYHPILYPACES
ncbi:hypothetical protein FGSG_10493 [Fusarium graminearum PH-1]|uniref:Chromosome 1, complete genome n=1 Tax=Gibberella zeae (strain ATCC MYA-4620 / CBS 123657 / FGSC 9075 / NRRL 31084 / PH-1) TaxID=229533 RepID=I1S193_GIBZE|nr:hypothetical protein FGSG_10493 [Fusarium graminearum PH-1]ESU17219.1 hypothetical protein FGSG_10493 [Fusarium graminearum PH-1]CEF75923.1 unnamed protein product [Fusarium graminearum]|eukprot:XP_011319481.1 hypothetical protein FGSG_10493 [Fusarium graminearum PH-1]